METINIILITLMYLLYLISIFLNSLGIYLLSATRPLNSGKILLINLAISEIFFALIDIPTKFIHIPSLKSKTLIVSASSMPYYFAMFMITIDRLVAFLFPFKHRVMVTNRRLTFAIVASWVLALLIGLCLFIINEGNHLYIYIWIAFDAAYILLCAITYGLIFIKILKRRKFVNNQQDVNGPARQQNVTSNNRFFKIIALIILSFLIFILVPDIFFHFYHTNNETVMKCLDVVWTLGFVADPITYIFLQDHLRLLLKKKLCKCKQETVPESTCTQQDTAL